MSDPTAIGFIGCGNISDTYLAGALRSRLVRVEAVADADLPAATLKAAKYGLRATTVDALLDDPAISVVVNLTPAVAHASVTRRILDAGKHAYSEKPLATTVADARALVAHAGRLGLHIGCAPDTFMGGGHQAVRRAVDRGSIGRVVGGAATIMHRGMEHWHPNPTSFYKEGGGPVLDLAGYYVTQLVNVLGPVRSVAAVTGIGIPRRRIATGPLAGTMIDVEVPTMVNGALDFACGASVALSASWEVHGHGRNPIELYGTDGSIIAPDPDLFGGHPMLLWPGGAWTPLSTEDLPFHADNATSSKGLPMADYRIVGLLDMVTALRRRSPFRAGSDLALHVLEVLEGLVTAGTERRHVAMTTSCERPEAMPSGGGEEVFEASAPGQGASGDAATSALEAAGRG